MRRVLPLLLLLLALAACSSQPVPTVVVYCALDQVYAEPILRDFERTSGIRVLPRYDVEATKTSGLVNLLLAEQYRPRCDVFWNNEMLQTEVLRQEGVLEPYRSPGARDIPERWKDPEGYWTGFAARIRVILYNRKLVKGEPPAGLEDLLDPRWKGQAAMARPLFGTTLTHFVCLQQVLGPTQVDRLLQGMLANQVQIVDGNSVVKDLVSQGKVAWGYTDSDDAHLAILEGAPVTMVIPDQEGPGTLLIPNTVAVIRRAPHPAEARRLVDHLLSREVEEKLARSDSLQIPLHPGARPAPGTPRLDEFRTMDVQLRKAAAGFRPVLDILRLRMLR